ncbi:trypsin-like serine peptidase [Caballeronia sordidicola]|uniref:Putative protease n=1 Tax=Caballeronia sordidicola TaxID=196367 RepID=A0A226WRF4_CABSO|nr:serine protease [Caballeronia sordidicola]OXC73410.1 putative protease [Caballeronia sordidicola]
MELGSRVERITRFLTQISEGNIENVMPLSDPDAETFGILPELMPDEASSANEGLNKIKLGRKGLVTSDEADGLEAIIMLRERPVFFLDKDRYSTLKNPWTVLNAEATRERLAKAARAIGRIELPTQLMYPFGGTGFLVGNGLLMTNRHVAQLFSHGVGVEGLLFTSGDAAVDFQRERYTPRDDHSNWFEIERVLMVHPYWDMALLRVKGLQGREALRLSVDEPSVGQSIVTIGYPARDDRNDLAEQDRIFERIYNAKRFMPGSIRPRARIQSFDQMVVAATHDASTLGGCSGSAVLDPDSAEVVALHFAGEYLIRNYGVPAMELACNSPERYPRRRTNGTQLGGASARQRAGACRRRLAPHRRRLRPPLRRPPCRRPPPRIQSPGMCPCA